MSRKTIGGILFWLGVVGVIAMQALTWWQTPMQRTHTAAELTGTAYAVWGMLFWIRTVGENGLSFALIGVLVSTSEKGSYTWLLGLLPAAGLSTAMLWAPTRYVPELFGIGGAVILISYFGMLWIWTRSHHGYVGAARTGGHIKLVGYSFLVSTGLLLCLYFGSPDILALADLQVPSKESILVTLSMAMLILLAGEYVASRGSKVATAGASQARVTEPVSSERERIPA